jgi:predicted component of type VI protein secretion system
VSKLVLHIPGGGTRDIKLDRDRITIGRRADNDVHLPYPAVSAEHAAIVTVLDDSFLEDLQSTNGTLVNGKRITKHFLRDHDAIDLGRVQLLYLLNDDELVEPLAANTEMIAVVPSSGVDDARGATPASEADHDDAQVEHLLAELMNSDENASVAVEIPRLAPAPTNAQVTKDRRRSEATAGAYLEVTSGPNAGQIASLTKREFMLGQSGSTKAIVRREGDSFKLVPVDANVLALVNGATVPADGVSLAYGDAIEVAGVKLRFGRRAPH